ncbi:3793_t:CDS:1 [Cetraspora pellucida]|uniref:3793_t:CDS:1 n=1 Tax=Cetraspora pellucida TaxID=1433469 RepID=A0ACA9N2P0_9GLOM|nr:3793_t:CDS:1 [Cetraspora pellucida]
MPDGTRRRLVKDDFERQTTPLFLVIKNFNCNEDTENILPITVTPIEVPEYIDVDVVDYPEDKARFYVEENWPLFEQAFKHICTERTANNWRHVCAMMEWSKLVQMEEEIQLVERKRHRQTIWGSTSKKPYLMYLPCLSKSDKENGIIINEAKDSIVIEDEDIVVIEDEIL